MITATRTRMLPVHDATCRRCEAPTPLADWQRPTRTHAGYSNSHSPAGRMHALPPRLHLPDLALRSRQARRHVADGARCRGRRACETLRGRAAVSGVG